MQFQVFWNFFARFFNFVKMISRSLWSGGAGKAKPTYSEDERARLMKAGRMASSEGPPPGMMNKHREEVADQVQEDPIAKTDDFDYLAEMENVVHSEQNYGSYGSEAEQPREGWVPDVEQVVDESTISAEVLFLEKVN